MKKVQIKGHNLYKRWLDLNDAWRDCVDCPLCEERNSVVHYRGKMPCHTLFVGEAPGETEDILGYPMVGPTKDHIHYWATEAGIESYGVINVVACRPPDNRDPVKSEVEACWPRVEALAAMADPTILVLCGSVAQKYGTHLLPRIPKARICHPAWLVRMQWKGQHDLADVERRRALLTIKKVLAQ